ncbi:MAG: zf-TFIIB domain-containing protein [Clostridiales bacterium]
MKNCSLCDVYMNEFTKADILIDICPKCEGIWLDKLGCL